MNVDHQLIYKNYGDGCRFHISTPKTDSGIRVIPMTQEVQKAFEEQRKINFMLAKDKSYEVDGYSGFVFTAKSGRPLMPYGVNSVLYNIVDAYNKAEVQRQRKNTGKQNCFQRFQLMLCDTQPAREWQSAVWTLRYCSTLWDTLILMWTMEVYNHLATGQGLKTR